jgi:integrase
VLLAAPMRIKNLASITLDRHLVQIREGGSAHLVLPGPEVKNKAALEFPLPPEVLALIHTYIRRALPVLAGGPSRFLFPARSGGTKPEAQLSVQLKKAIARHAGLDLNVHAFRHLAAMLFLRRHPGEYETVRLLLGHKSLATTVRAYCGLEDSDAFRRYDQLMDSYRQHGEAAHAG